MAKGKKTGGRRPGSKNIISKEADEIFERLKFCPLEGLVQFAKGDWKALGYESETRTCFTAAGIEFEESIIKPEHRLAALKEACKYRFAQKKALELSSPDGTGFKIIVEEYPSKTLK
jgi:hypothetical protein